MVSNLFDGQKKINSQAAVSCSPDTPGWVRVKMGIWLMGRLGRARVVHGVGAWVHGVGAWHVHGCMGAWMMWWCVLIFTSQLKVLIKCPKRDSKLRQ